MDLPLAELLEQARRGDPRAFEALIRPHVAAVRRFTCGFTRRREDADDLAQETLLKAFRSLHTFEGRSALSTWLFTIARSVCSDFHRSRAYKEQRAEVEMAVELTDLRHPGVLKDEKERAEVLWRALRRLEPEFRVPLVLFEIEGMAYEDIARVEGVPVGTVRSRLSRARARLRGILSEGQPSGTQDALLPSNRASGNAR